MKNNKFVKQIPNILTMLNIVSGLTAILLLFLLEHSHKIVIVASLICFGALIDFLDGFLARRLNAVSGMGRQLDSFADLVTFGIAPVCLVNYISFSQIVQYPYFAVISVFSVLFAIAGVYRLARYNISDSTTILKVFPLLLPAFYWRYIALSTVFLLSTCRRLCILW